MCNAHIIIISSISSSGSIIVVVVVSLYISCAAVCLMCGTLLALLINRIYM